MTCSDLHHKERERNTHTHTLTHTHTHTHTHVHTHMYTHTHTHTHTHKETQQLHSYIVHDSLGWAHHDLFIYVTLLIQIDIITSIEYMYLWKLHAALACIPSLLHACVSWLVYTCDTTYLHTRTQNIQIHAHLCISSTPHSGAHTQILSDTHSHCTCFSRATCNLWVTSINRFSLEASANPSSSLTAAPGGKNSSKTPSNLLE